MSRRRYGSTCTTGKKPFNSRHSSPNENVWNDTVKAVQLHYTLLYSVTVHSTMNLYNEPVQCTLVQCILYNIPVLCTMYTVQYTCTVYNVYCTIYNFLI